MIRMTARRLQGWFGRVGVTAVLIVAVAGLGVPDAPAQTAAEAPMVVGALASLTGPFAKVSSDMKDGIEFYFKEHGFRVAGRPVRLIVEDDEAEPGKALSKARRLVERERAHVLTGILHSGVALALRGYVDQEGVPVVISVAGAPALTQEQKSPRVFRVVRAFGQGDAVGGWWAYHKLSWRKVIMIYLNYAAGQAAAAGFKKTFVAAGGQVLEELKPPPGTADFAPYISKVGARAGEIDGLWAYIVGADAIRFIKQYPEFGLRERVKLFANAEIFSEAVLPAQGRDAVGHLSYSDEGFYAGVARKAAETLQFAKAFTAAYGRAPGSLEAHGYTSAQVIAEAAKALGGKVEDRGAFEKAIRQVRFRSVYGREFAFDPNQGSVVDVVIQRIGEEGGKPIREFGEIIPDVDQFWRPR